MNSRLPAHEDSHSVSNVFGWAAVSIVLAIGVWLRIHFAREPFWVDELHTAWAIDCDFSKVAVRAGQGNQTPLYFWLLWALQSVVGYSDSLLRGVSVTLGAAVMLVVGWLTLRLTNSLSAVVVAIVIVAFDPIHLYYASEARPYVLLQLLVAIQVASVTLLMAEKSQERQLRLRWLRLFVTSATTALLLLTHVTGLWLVVAEFVFLAATWRWKPQRDLLVAITLGSLAMTIALPVMQGAFAKRSDWWAVSDIDSFIQQAGTLAGVLAIPIIIATLNAFRKKPDAAAMGVAPKLHVALLLATCCLIPFLIVIAAQLCRFAPLASMRYAIVGLVPTALLAAYATFAIGAKHIRVAVAILAIAVFAFTNPLLQNVWQTGQLAHFRNENWPQAVAQISKDDAKIVFLFANLVEDSRLKTVGKSDHGFINYLKFPLASPAANVSPAANLQAQQIVPMPTLTGQRWTDEHLQMLNNNETGWIVMRAPPALADEITSELTSRATQQQISLDLTSFEQDRNDIRLVRFRVVSDKE